MEDNNQFIRNEEKEETEEENKKVNEENESQKSKRSVLSLEGGKKPFSLYTRRVINTSKIREYLSENSTHGLCGGYNLGNTCFMNSSIACLSNCIELTCYFLSGDYMKDINKENELGMGGRLAEAWGDLLQEYWVQHTNVGDPTEFKKVFGRKIKRFSGFNQQDSNEFIDLFLDNLNEDLNSVTKKEYIELKEKQDEESELDCSKRFWDNYLKRNDSIVTDLFCGQLKCTITCPQCKLINITFDPFNTLNLNIPETKRRKSYEQFEFFYVPKYCLRTPIKVVIKGISKTTTFKDCFRCLKNDENFKYHNMINKVIVNNIVDKHSTEFFNAEKSLTVEHYEGNFCFCYDIIDEKEDINIPIYFKDGKKLSEYPRLIMISQGNSTLDDIRRKIYFNIRKLILSPLKGEDEEIDALSREIKKYLTDIDIKEKDIFALIDKEYQEIFNPEINEKNNEFLSNFVKDIPFKVYLTQRIKETAEDEEKIYIIDENNFRNLSSEFIELTNIKTYKDQIINLLNLMKNDNYNIVVELKKESKYINPLLYKINNCIRYSCDYIEEEEENNNILTLKKCFELFTKEEKLKKGDEWYCPRCKEHVLANKKMEIFYSPKIFIICFKRFIKNSFYWERNDETIYFPLENLDMKEFIVGPDSEHSKYDLFAVSQHYGGTGFGHYTAICKNFNKWYSYNDSSIHETKAENVLSDAAYVLFYRRQTD